MKSANSTSCILQAFDRYKDAVAQREAAEQGLLEFYRARAYGETRPRWLH
jgi:hypothetical protein